MYSFTFDGRHYDAYADGTPFTLADIWREVEGLAGVRIWCGDRLVLDRAGEQTGRRVRIRARYLAARASLAYRRRESYEALAGRRAA